LVEIEQTPEDPIFKVDCVFAGKTEFPKPYHENEKESVFPDLKVDCRLYGQISILLQLSAVRQFRRCSA
jgi:hypothetical protein